MDGQSWKALRDIARMPEVAQRRPNVGATVRVIAGKRLGVVGTVVWHGRDRYKRDYYLDEMSRHLLDVQGRYGFRVKVATSDLDEPAFFIDADQVCVL